MPETDRFPNFGALLTRLAELRLQRGFTFRQLAEHINLTVADGKRISAMTLFGALKNPDTRPQDRTLYKIERYLVDVDEPHHRIETARAPRARRPLVQPLKRRRATA